MSRAVFVDRDGILNAAIVKKGLPHPPTSLAELKFLPGIRERLRGLKELNLVIVCVTNQPDVARHTVSRAAVDAINTRVRMEIPLDDLLVCFHDNVDNCACRKPRAGLLLQAASQFGIDLPSSYMIGDRWKDIACGAAVGCTTVFVDYRYSEDYKGPDPGYTTNSAAGALDYVLSMERWRRQLSVARNSRTD